MEFETPILSLRQLQYALAVDEHRSFRRAAEQCRVAQPSLSAQLKQLESALGVQLFERSQSGVIRTPAAEAILDHARAILVAVQDLTAVADDARDPWAGIWTIGVIPTLAPYLLPLMMPALRAQHEALEVRWIEDQTAALVDGVERGELTAALVALEANLGTLHQEQIIEDRFVLALPPDHELARTRRRISLDVLSTEPILLLDDGHCLREQALELCAHSNSTELGFRATSLTTLTEMVANGVGVTLLPEMAASSEAYGGRLAIRRFEAPEPSRTIGMVWRPRTPLAPALLETAALVARQIRKSRRR